MEDAAPPPRPIFIDGPPNTPVCPGGISPFLHVISTDITDTARQHNGLMVTAQFLAVVAADFLFIGPEIAEQCRTAEFVIKCRAAERTFSHDVIGADNAVRSAEILLPTAG